MKTLFKTLLLVLCLNFNTTLYAYDNGDYKQIIELLERRKKAVSSELKYLKLRLKYESNDDEYGKNEEYKQEAKNIDRWLKTVKKAYKLNEKKEKLRKSYHKAKNECDKYETMVETIEKSILKH